MAILHALIGLSLYAGVVYLAVVVALFRRT